jgi:hypothetical protein
MVTFNAGPIKAVDWRPWAARNLRRSLTFASLIEDQARQAKADFQVVVPVPAWLGTGDRWHGAPSIGRLT